jgi:dipeptidyl aminopeptidase/acylaminoacyl peptidase
MAKRETIRWKSIELRCERRLSAGLVHHRLPALSRDGRWVAFAALGGLDATWVVTDRRGRVARTFDGPADGGAAFGEGDALAFGRRAGQVAEIWLTPSLAASPVRLLGGDGRVYREPAWSPDGAQLAFAVAEAPDARAHLELLEVSTGARRVLTSDALRSDARPAFSPDGSELFFEGAVDGDVAIWALALDPAAPSKVERVTPTDVVSRRPAPLSRELVVIERPQHDGGASHLVLFDRRTVRERDLTPDGSDQREPSLTRGKSGKLKLAYVAPSSAAEGEPRRLDVFTARLRGLAVGDQPPLPDVVEVPPTHAAPGEHEHEHSPARDEPSTTA